MKRRIKKKKIFRKDKSFLLWSIPIIILISFLIFSIIKVEKRKAALSQRIEELRKEITNLEKENADLEKAKEEGKSSYYIEKILREKGLYKKKGEKVAVILTPLKNTEEKKKEPESFFQKLWKKFGLPD